MSSVTVLAQIILHCLQDDYVRFTSICKALGRNISLFFLRFTDDTCGSYWVPT